MANEFKFILGWLILISLKTSKSRGQDACPDTSARMCYASTANTGTSVIIDTTGARATDNTILTPLCSCRVTVRNAKLFSVNITGTTEVCGSIITIKGHTTTQNISIQSGNNCSRTLVENQSLYGERSVSLDIDIIKQQNPFLVDYCIEITTPVCSENEFQCRTGECIDGNLRCDNNPGDCPQDDDEEDCTGLTCPEATTACEDGSRCYTSEQKCDNHTDCTDDSDEKNCTGAGGLGSTTTVADTTPSMSVECFESSYFSSTTVQIGPGQTDPGDNNKPGVIVGAVIGSLVGVYILVGLLILLVVIIKEKLKKKGKVDHQYSPEAPGTSS